MSGLFQQIMYELGIKQSNPSAYHPASQAALEHFHQSINYDQKILLSISERLFYLLLENTFNIPLVLPHSNLFLDIPLRDPLKVVKEKELSETNICLITRQNSSGKFKTK